jgi:hypothetical protein
MGPHKKGKMEKKERKREREKERKREREKERKRERDNKKATTLDTNSFRQKPHQCGATIHGMYFEEANIQTKNILDSTPCGA